MPVSISRIAAKQARRSCVHISYSFTFRSLLDVPPSHFRLIAHPEKNEALGQAKTMEDLESFVDEFEKLCKVSFSFCWTLLLCAAYTSLED